MNNLKIADFGLSQQIFPNELLDFPCGTINYIGKCVIINESFLLSNLIEMIHGLIYSS